MSLSCFERPSAAVDNPPDWVLALDLFEEGTDFSRVRAVGAPDGTTLYFLAPTDEHGVFDLVQASADGSGGVAVVEMTTLVEQGAEWSAGVDDAQWTVVLVVGDGFERVRFETIEVPVTRNLAVACFPLGEWPRRATLCGPAGTKSLEFDQTVPAAAARMSAALGRPGLLDRLPAPTEGDVRLLGSRDEPDAETP